jgi:hypothetical protein
MAPVILGRKSTLFLAYAYQFSDDREALLGREGRKKGSWKPRRIEGAALLPHLDEYVRKGELLRAYDVAGDLRGAFGGRDPWTFTDGEKEVEVTIAEPPRLYTLDTGYAFLVIGVAPRAEKDPDFTLARWEDTAYQIVRAGTSKVKASGAQMKKWLEANGLATEEPMPMRRWLARFVPGLRPDAPRGTPRTTAPALLAVVLSKDSLPREELHRLRLMHRSDQVIEPSEGEGDEMWRISSREQCLFSAFGFSWVVHLDGSQFLADAPHMVRDRYVYKWLLVEHQRLCLLALATECADMSKGLDGSHFAKMRMRLLEFIATYNFRHISNEERHDRFYMRVRNALGIDDLLAEVREEVVEIDTQLAARRSDTLNHVIAFLTLVLTPVGIVIGVFQSDTLPGKIRFGHFVSAHAWGRLLTHPPFLFVLTAAVIGAVVYVRVFGFQVVTQLLRALIVTNKHPDENIEE